MMSPVSISVHALFHSPTLHSREQANLLYSRIMKLIRENEEIYIDFSEIQFISRSFADELIHLSNSSKKMSQIVFCCMAYDVEQMIRAVTRTQNGRTSGNYLPVQRFPNTESLLRYFAE